LSMIQAASMGIWVLGEAGRQGSLAADFSLTQFGYTGRLITVTQAIFSAVSHSSSVPLYRGFLMVGYATIYTMLPVFSLVLDRSVSDQIAITYLELFKELTKGRPPLTKHSSSGSRC